VRARLPDLGGPPPRWLIVRIDADAVHISVRNIGYASPPLGPANRLTRLFLKDRSESDEKDGFSELALMALHVESWCRSARQPIDLLALVSMATNNHSMLSRAGLDENDGEVFVAGHQKLDGTLPDDLERHVRGVVGHATVLTRFVGLLQGLVECRDSFAGPVTESCRQEAEGECPAGGTASESDADGSEDEWL
jgi:hypothetical protein